MSAAFVERRQILRWTLMLAATGPAAAAGGCSFPGSGPAPRQFRLTPATQFAAAPPAVAWSLAIEEPQAPHAIGDLGIARISAGNEVDYYQGVQWADRSTALLRTAIVESFQNSGKIPVVVQEWSGLRPDYLLKTNLRDFQAEPAGSGPPQAHVTLEAILIRLPRRTVVATSSFQAVAPAAADNVEAIVAAFDRALDQVLGALVAWVLTTPRPERARPA